ncbi:hypothetical protein [Candidatus Mycobacterium methanotrophicum]|nr:hypothetical protein [Candidatus Mycobacterium methanotrophicum]
MTRVPPTATPIIKRPTQALVCVRTATDVAPQEEWAVRDVTAQSG